MGNGRGGAVGVGGGSNFQPLQTPHLSHIT